MQKPLAALHRALDFDSFWDASRNLLSAGLPYHSCSLLFGIADYQPHEARHHVAMAEKRDYAPATSLSVSGGYLASHRHVSVYTYSQIVAQDPDAPRRRHAQESVVGDWNEFAHLAFWNGGQPQAVLSVRRATCQTSFEASELQFLHDLHPLIDAGLWRVKACAAQRTRLLQYEKLLEELPHPVMLADAWGEVLFASPQSQYLANRWNQSLRRSAVSAVRAPRLPADVAQVLESPDRFGVTDWDGASPLLLSHPDIAGLSVQIERSDAWGERSSAPKQWAYLLTFICLPGPTQSASALSPRALATLRLLSPAERKVAALVGEGLRNDEIAGRLHRSRRTVEFQLNSVYRKLNFTRRAQLIRALI